MTTLSRLLLQWGPHPGPHGPGPHGPMGPTWGPMGSGGGWMAPGAGLVPVLFGALLVGLVLGAAYLLVRGADGRRDADGADEALAALRTRYATGEIDAEEFEARRTRLGGGSNAG